MRSILRSALLASCAVSLTWGLAGCDDTSKVTPAPSQADKDKMAPGDSGKMTPADSGKMTPADSGKMTPGDADKDKMPPIAPPADKGADKGTDKGADLTPPK